MAEWSLRRWPPIVCPFPGFPEGAHNAVTAKITFPGLSDGSAIYFSARTASSVSRTWSAALRSEWTKVILPSRAMT